MHCFKYFPNEYIEYVDSIRTQHKFTDCSFDLNLKLFIVCEGKEELFYYNSVRTIYVPATQKHIEIDLKETQFLQECLDYHEFFNGPLLHYVEEHSPESEDEGIDLITWSS